MLSPVLNSFGLLFDIVGVVLLFKFGLPEEISRSGALRVTHGRDEKEAKKAKLYDQFGRAGLWFLIIGFVLQLVSNLFQLIEIR